jgi:hypothetical protein
MQDLHYKVFVIVPARPRRGRALPSKASHGSSAVYSKHQIEEGTIRKSLQEKLALSTQLKK